MSKPQLQPETCRECDKDILVAPFSPWEGDAPTGCAASCWDSEACREYFVGWICLECAFNAAMRDKDEPGVHGIFGGPGGTVLDPFCGSGTTCAVAKRWGRNWIGIDVRESQVELARRRLAEVEIVRESA